MKENYWGSIYFAENEGICGIVSMRENHYKQLLRSYFSIQTEDADLQKESVIETDACLIKSYINSKVPFSTDQQPSAKTLNYFCL